MSYKCRFSDAASVLLRWGLAADKSKAVHSQCKVVPHYECHTVACKVRLDFLELMDSTFRPIWVPSSCIYMLMIWSKQTNATMIVLSKSCYLLPFCTGFKIFMSFTNRGDHNSCAFFNNRIDAFSNNEHGSCAYKLLKAYREGDVEGIKYVVKSSSLIPHLDHMV